MTPPQRPDEWACIPFMTKDPRGETVKVISTEFVDYVFALWNYYANKDAEKE